MLVCENQHEQPSCLLRHAFACLHRQGINGTGTQDRTVTAGRAPADKDPASARAPADVRHVTKPETRTRAERNILDVEVFPCRQEVGQFQELTLQKNHALVALLVKLVGRLVGVFLVCLNGGSNSDGISLARVAVIPLGDFLVQVVTIVGIAVAARLERLPHLVIRVRPLGT